MTPPLQGVHVLVTRSKDQAQTLSEKIISVGGVPIETPLLTYVAYESGEEKKLLELEKYDWVFFASVNGVAYFFEKLDGNIRIPCKIGVVGERTKEAVEQYGHEVHFIPTQYTALAFAKEFSSYFSSQSILLVQGNLSRPTLQKSLINKGHNVQNFVVYKTEVNHDIKDTLKDILTEKKVDVLTFTSPSTIQAFYQLGGSIVEAYKSVLTVCIGPTTAEEAEKCGFKNILTPKNHTVDGIINELENHYKNRM
ncbi:uroporphyrinogen-III synthase [Bacillaceae bacterium S4-13-58]